MKVISGMEQLQMNEHGPIGSINWDRLLVYNGSLGTRISANKRLGQVLRIVSWLLIITAIVVVVASGELQIIELITGEAEVGIIWWLGVLMWCYAQFLLSDKHFHRNLQQKDLRRQRLPIELTEYIDLDTWSIIDKHQHSPEFLVEVIKEILTDKKVGDILQRVGLIGKQEVLLRKLANSSLSLHSNKRLFEAAMYNAKYMEAEMVNNTSFFLAAVDLFWREVLLEFEISGDEVEAIKTRTKLHNREEHYHQIWKRMAILKPTGTVNKAYTSRFAPTLEQYGTDLTKQAASGRFVVSLGKEDAMSQMLRVLERSDKAALLVGELGVGKSHFLQYLAVKMVVEDVSPALRDKRLVSFDMPRAFTVSSSLENFKLTLQNMFDEIADSKDIVLVLDNIDQGLDVRDDLRAEIVNMIAKAIDSYAIQVVATASDVGFRKFIQPQRLLMNGFQVVELKEPAPEITTQILIDVADKFTRKSGIHVELSAIRQIVKLAPRFDHERAMPDKGVILLEESVLLAQDRGLDTVSAEVVDSLISSKVGVDVGKISSAESQRLLELENILHQRVVGQEQAIKAVASALRRARAGLQHKNKPIASFLFFGPTGVGKTEVAKTLAEAYYGDEKLMTRIDMSEYQEQENLQRLIGSEVNGEFTGGYLTEAVRKRPFSLVLLDEIEKANPKVLDLLLQILDEGVMTDGVGRKVDFTNTIIIITSNAASHQIADLNGQGLQYPEVLRQVTPTLRQVFRVELLNRFDQVIMFKPLVPIEIQAVARNMLNDLTENLLDQGYHFSYTDNVVEELVNRGYDPIYGAREMRRTIRDYVEDKIATAIVKGELKPGGQFSLTKL